MPSPSHEQKADTGARREAGAGAGHSGPGTGPAGARTGLRERKKAKTRAAIQAHAIRLFRENGYDATTVEQIAQAAEVSPSTFFRYFPSKEDLVLYDALDPVFLAAYRDQPAGLNQVAAVRAAMRQSLDAFRSTLPREWERQQIILDHPGLRARMLEEFVRTLDLLADAMAERTGRSADDVAVRATVGAILGVGLSAWLAHRADPSEFMALFEAGLEHLERGLPL